jgi:hypothetical protein
MRLAIREYLAGLRESEELDALLPDLLLSMGMRPVETPKRGVKQYGVDIAAVGQLPDEGSPRSLFLFVIKSGDIRQADWAGPRQAVRPSLDDVRYNYVRNCISPEFLDLPVVVVVCCGGKIEQDVCHELAALEDSFQASGIRLTKWDGSYLSILIERHLMEEPTFPSISQHRLRRALALIDLNEYRLDDYYALLADTLSEGQNTLTAKQRSHRMRQANLCLRIVAKWAEEADNLRQALVAAERTILNSWDWMRQLGFPPSLWPEFGKVYRTYDMLQNRYFEKLRPALGVEDGLFGYGGDRIEYPIRVFETIGFLSTLGFEALAAIGISRFRRNLAEVTDGLASLIALNPASKTPCFDEHSIEITLGLLLLYRSGHQKDARDWAIGLSRHIVNACRLGRHYPLSSDSYDQLIDMEAEGWAPPERTMDLSTILPILAEWLLVLGMDDEYEHLRRASEDLLAKTTLQYWYPNSESEVHIYARNAANKSGTSLVLSSLPNDRDTARAALGSIRTEFPGPDIFSCYSKGLPQLLFIAARHYRTPLHPYYWQTYL